LFSNTSRSPLASDIAALRDSRKAAPIGCLAAASPPLSKSMGMYKPPISNRDKKNCYLLKTKEIFFCRLTFFSAAAPKKYPDLALRTHTAGANTKGRKARKCEKTQTEGERAEPQPSGNPAPQTEKGAHPQVRSFFVLHSIPEQIRPR